MIVIRADGDVRIPEGFGTIDKYEVCEYACSVGVSSCGSWTKEASRKPCWQPDQEQCAEGCVHGAVCRGVCAWCSVQRGVRMVQRAEGCVHGAACRGVCA